MALIDEANTIVQQQVVAHERDDEGNVYPRSRELLAGDRPWPLGHEPRAPRNTAPGAPARPRRRGCPCADVDRYLLRDAQRVIEAIEVLVRMHTAQEEEIYEAVQAA